MKTLYKFLIRTLFLAGLSLHLAWAAAPPGKGVTPSIALQGGSTSEVKWKPPASSTYKVHVFVPSTGKVTNALYRVYPKGKGLSNKCDGTGLKPCFAVTIDQNQHRNAWVQLTLNGDPETRWAFTKTTGYVAAVADNLGSETLLNVSGEIRFEDMIRVIGQPYQGGIIFYVDGSGQHGLIAAPSDQSTCIVWWNGSYINTGATDTAVGTGQDNTNKIIVAQGAGTYAAMLADNLELNGYNDWFLPSKDELRLMYLNIGPGAPPPLTNIGGFGNGLYWSSSEYDWGSAWVQFFDRDYRETWSKPWCAAVRAARAF